MAFFDKFFRRENPNEAMRPLYEAIVAKARQVDWYVKGAVPDSLDGRFDMIAAILSLVFLRLEQDENMKQEIAWLTELFVTDMDGQLRQIGIGDMVVGKHIGKMMSALGGRLGAYRDAATDEGDWKDALSRNLYRGEPVDEKALEFVSSRLRAFRKGLNQSKSGDILSGKITGVSA